MRSADIQEQIYQWALGKNFTAPYGVLKGQHVNSRGRTYLSVTFGRARTLDASVDIYNNSFMILRTNQTGSQVFKSVDDLMAVLIKL